MGAFFELLPERHPVYFSYPGNGLFTDAESSKYRTQRDIRFHYFVIPPQPQKAFSRAGTWVIVSGCRACFSSRSGFQNRRYHESPLGAEGCMAFG